VCALCIDSLATVIWEAVRANHRLWECERGNCLFLTNQLRTCPTL